MRNFKPLPTAKPDKADNKLSTVMHLPCHLRYQILQPQGGRRRAMANAIFDIAINSCRNPLIQGVPLAAPNSLADHQGKHDRPLFSLK